MFRKHLGSLLLTGVVVFGAAATEDCGPDPDPVPAACKPGAQRQVVTPEGVAGIEVCVDGQWVYYPAQ